MEINIGTDKDPKLIKIGKGTSEKERNSLMNLIKEYRDMLDFSYDELKAYREDVFQLSTHHSPHRRSQRGQTFSTKT